MHQARAIDVSSCATTLLQGVLVVTDYDAAVHAPLYDLHLDHMCPSGSLRYVCEATHDNQCVAALGFASKY